jgi:hypothetical protein
MFASGQTKAAGYSKVENSKVKKKKRKYASSRENW